MGSNKIAEAWDGKPIDLGRNENPRNFSNTPNGDIVLVMQNMVNGSGTATIEISSGSKILDTVELPANPSGLPTLFIHNYGADNLQVENITEGEDNHYVRIAAVGQGMYETGDLPADSQEYEITPIFAEGGCRPTAPFAREGVTPASRTTLSFGQRSASAAAFVLYENSDALVYGVNWPGKTPKGYESTVESNSFDLRRNFMGNTVTVSNVSPAASGASFVRLRGKA